ncbi:inositol monophosphatase family protein [Ponticaulis profundi]|uniref:Inositol monophosphatase family protein n=1 Tax=Ponticaulis profundi TaxID=2665222 RepID=A0ABW1SAZ3_9PROT
MQDADYSADMTLLREAALEAGKIAMAYYCKSLKIWDKEPNHPVTEADLAVNTFLMETLRAARPDYGWLSEETLDTPDRLDRERVFVVDPIDGTRAFMNGDPHFCIALAVLENDQPVASVIYAPAHKELYEAYYGGGARMNGQTILASKRTNLVEGRLIADPGMFDHPGWPQVWPDLVHPEVKPNATAYRMALVADGRWDAVMVLGNKSDWDIVAATLIIREAGGKATCHNGVPFVFNQKVAAQQSLIAGGPVIHGLLVERCRHICLRKPGDS